MAWGEEGRGGIMGGGGRRASRQVDEIGREKRRTVCREDERAGQDSPIII